MINTYSHGTASNEPNAWERHSRDTLVGNLPNGDVVLLVPKPGPGEMLDPVKLGAVVEPLLEEICRQYVPGTEYQRLHTAPDVNRKID